MWRPGVRQWAGFVGCLEEFSPHRMVQWPGRGRIGSLHSQLISKDSAHLNSTQERKQMNISRVDINDYTCIEAFSPSVLVLGFVSYVLGPSCWAFGFGILCFGSWVVGLASC